MTVCSLVCSLELRGNYQNRYMFSLDLILTAHENRHQYCSMIENQKITKHEKFN